MKLSKTDYLIFKDCGKNAWFKVHKPDIYYAKQLSAFDEGIIKTGNDVDVMARDLFKGGFLLEDRDAKDQTMVLVKSQTPVIYQPVFETELYKIICDILVWNPVFKVYDLYEVKASNSGDNKKAKDELYSYDIAFQYLVLKELGVPIGRLNLIRLNSEYVRGALLDINQLFSIEDFTEKVLSISDIVDGERKNAYEILSSDTEPFGECSCVATRGRSSHCTTFSESNRHLKIPEYNGVHDISRIGGSKKKLAQLVDMGIFNIVDVPDDFELSEVQWNQIRSVKDNKEKINKEEIKNFLDKISLPISFFDYETFAAGVPRFVGYSSFNQIPFQFSLHILEDYDKELIHKDFIFTENKNPDQDIINAMQKYFPKSGSIIVWYKPFEMGRNKELAIRNPEHKIFLEDINSRIIDLRDVFTNQYFIHPDFKGKTSIKYVLPVLSDLSYKNLDIKEGATASNTWNDIVNNKFSKEEKEEKIQQLRTYCEQDTLAMYLVWKYLREI